jgi:peptidoglycan L-alanyl-D-glutamate endopeptidase CwlK
MASRSINDLHPDLAASFNQVLAKWHETYPTLPVPFLSTTHRPDAEQNELYAIGRTVKGKIVTNAKAGQSPHNYLPALAYDIAFKKPNGQLDWNEDLFKKFSRLLSTTTKQVDWGGNWKFKDLPHFELNNWKQIIKK